MIELTRLNGSRLAVNSDLILFAESAPDTLLTMISGEKLIVAEGLEEVAERMAATRARALAEASRLCPEGLVILPGAALRAQASASAACAVPDSEAVDEECAGIMRRRRRAEL